MTIRAALADDAEAVVRLVSEYVDGLGQDISFQDVETELADPLEFYDVVLLAENGCVALRRIDDATCEMKRLYVRPHARGTGLGRQLAEALLAEARARGYRRIVLDTLSAMASAQTLYRSLGFRDTKPYRYNPLPGASFLELEL